MNSPEVKLPRHIPYDGSHPPFKIGLHPLDLEDWIEVDDRLGEYLDKKEAFQKDPGKIVFRAEAESLSAQAEALALIKDHMGSHFCDTHQLAGDKMRVGGREVDLAGDAPPLMTAGRLVQEDLVIMQRDDRGWRLTAASLCFPSSWSLDEKFGLPLPAVHQPVPGFGEGSRNADIIHRIFDNLKPKHPVWRMNWSVYADDKLYHTDRSPEQVGPAEIANGLLLRVEYQTLRKLAKTGAILFTIRIYIDRFSDLAIFPERTQITEGFVDAINGLSEEQIRYKGFVGSRQLLIDEIRKQAGLTG